jgi:peptide subunit release factor 1 (eRF1)
VKILSPLCPTGLIYGMGVEVCFDSYLRSLVSAYQKWEKQYTLTDVTGRSQQKKAISSRDVVEEPSFDYFDFGLMVQTVSEEKEKGEGKKRGRGKN